MKVRNIGLIIILLAFGGMALLESCTNSSKEFVSITIEITPPSTTMPDEQIYITGNNDVFRNWTPGEVPLSKQPNGNWSRTFQLPKDDRIAFKFTKGNWETEAVSKEGFVLKNFEYKVEKSDTIHFILENWKDLVYSPPQDTITGNIIEVENLYFPELADRKVWIWLPPEYDSLPQKRYPVCYLHDGQNVFNPVTSYTGFDWRVDEVADSLIHLGEMEPVIFVALANTVDRNEEYNDTDKGRKYASYLIERVKPYIDKHYRTLSGPENTGTMGSSMGGLISFILAWEHPEVFGKAACLSPAFKIWGSIDYVDNVERDRKNPKSIQLYIDNGTRGIDPKLQSGIDDMKKELENQGYSFKWVLDEGADHNELAWARRVHLPLLYLWGKGNP